MTKQSNGYQWYILALVVLTNIFVVAMPAMGMSVLAKEISEDLGLNLVQVGIVWGVGSLPGILTSLLGGVVGDKLGPKRILMAGTLIAGLLGAARGLTNDFLSITIVVILLGALTPFVSMNGIKTAGQWFPSHQLGLANGLIAAGMAFGFLLGSLLSATTFSPLLGGWRNVLIAYGLIGAAFTIPWFFTPQSPHQLQNSGAGLSMRAAILHVARLKNIWLLGLALFGIGGSIQGLLGYLPLYLRGLGWEAIRADGTLSAFHLISMLFVMPIAFWSDRLGSRKRLMLAAAAMVVLGSGLLSFASGSLIWLAVLMVGFIRDAFMAIFMTQVIETEGVGPTYAGTALGLTMAISGIGMFVAPPLGNSLAEVWPGAPFAVWSALAALGMLCLFQIKVKERLPELLVEVSEQ